MFAYAISLTRAAVYERPGQGGGVVPTRGREGLGEGAFCSASASLREGRGAGPGPGLHWFEKVRSGVLLRVDGVDVVPAPRLRKIPRAIGGDGTPTRHRHHETRNNTTTTQAASQNHAKARCNLGIMFASGIGVARDDSRAARYYLAAATGGVPRAMFDLAVLYARGRGVLKDDVAAVAWCERAAIAGDAAACVNMAHVLGQGLVGRCPDSRAARRWLDLATRRRGSRRDDARDTAVSSLVAAAPAPQLQSLVPAAPTSPRTRGRFSARLPV